MMQRWFSIFVINRETMRGHLSMITQVRSSRSSFVTLLERLTRREKDRKTKNSNSGFHSRLVRMKTRLETRTTLAVLGRGASRVVLRARRLHLRSASDSSFSLVVLSTRDETRSYLGLSNKARDAAMSAIRWGAPWVPTWVSPSKRATVPLRRTSPSTSSAALRIYLGAEAWGSRDRFQRSSDRVSRCHDVRTLDARSDRSSSSSPRLSSRLSSTVVVVAIGGGLQQCSNYSNSNGKHCRLFQNIF